MTAEFFNVDVVLQPYLVDRYGAPGAIVVKQVNYWGKTDPDGWWEVSYADMRQYTGLPVRTCRTQVAKLTEAGALEQERCTGNHGEGKPRYRVADGVLIEAQEPADSAGADSGTQGADRVTPRGADRVTPGGADRVTPTSVSDVLDEDENTSSRPSDEDGASAGGQPEPKSWEQPIVAELCALLADRVEQHRGVRPKTTKRALQAMDKLLRLGPLHVEGATGRTPEQVRGCIGYVFDALAEPGPSGFCWADQIRSADGLREKYHQIQDARRREGRAPAKQSEKDDAAWAIYEMTTGKSRDDYGRGAATDRPAIEVTETALLTAGAS